MPTDSKNEGMPAAPPEASLRAEPNAITRKTNESILLRSGYVLCCKREDGEDVLAVSAPNGELCLRMVLAAEGPIVEVQAKAMRLASSGDLTVDCERLELNARTQMTLRASDLTQIAEKDISVQAGGLIQSEAHAQVHRARLGDIALAANDDIALAGEQIRLNSPKTDQPAASWPGLGPIAQAEPTLTEAQGLFGKKPPDET